MSRADSAAATRRALLDSAAELLDGGGPGAVTLREVGARAGVSRGAPYRHFADKESLLTAVAAEGWQRVGDHMHALQADERLGPDERLRAALVIFVTISRTAAAPVSTDVQRTGGGPRRRASRPRSAVATSSWPSPYRSSANRTPSATGPSC